MVASLLTLNTRIPAAEHGGSPAIVLYDNGDWEITYQGDTPAISESGNYFGYLTFIDFFVDLMIFFDIGDVDDLDVSGDSVILFIEERINTGSLTEPCLVVYDDCEFDVMNRRDAEAMMAEADYAFNYIPVIDLFNDFTAWRGKVSEEIMWDGEGEPELDAGEVDGIDEDER